MRTSTALFATSLVTLPACAALAAPQQAFDNQQPSLALTLVTPAFGSFPDSQASQAAGATLGFVYDFAGAFAPGGSLAAAGQSLSFSSNIALGTVFGGAYGGDFNNFNLPNLVGRTIVGAGGGLDVGAAIGSESVTLTAAQTPAPNAPVAAQPYNTIQPSLALTPLIAVRGDFPNSNGATGTSAFIGQIANYGGTVRSNGSAVPGGWLPADGRVLPIAGNLALYAVLGTTYGGDGVKTFALPDLVGRIAIGADADNPLGSTKGSNEVSVNSSELPGPGQQPLSNDQPSLAVNYLIATTGTVPTANFNSFHEMEETLGQIVEFAGGTAPAGWTFANGRLLPISEYQDLFDLIGTTYGGDGVTDFAIPDLDGRTVIGANLPDASPLAKVAMAAFGDDEQIGDIVGADAIYLTQAELPTPVPEPSTWALMALGSLALGFIGNRRRSAPPAVGRKTGG